MIRTIGVADRETLEQNLKRLKLRHVRDTLDDSNEVTLEEGLHIWTSWPILSRRKLPVGKPLSGSAA